MGKGFETRRKLAQIGLAIAANEGFEAVTLNRLCMAAEMSRTGVFEAFGSMAAMRRALVEFGLEYWRDEVMERACFRAGMERIWEAWSRWLRHATTLPLFLELLPGIAEADAAHPEAQLRAEVVKHWRSWERFVVEAVKSAASAGELNAPVDGEQLHETLLRLASTLPWQSRMKGTDEAVRRIAREMFERIGAPLRTPLSPYLLERVLDLGYCAVGADPLDLGGQLLNVPDLRQRTHRRRVDAFNA